MLCKFIYNILFVNLSHHLTMDHGLQSHDNNLEEINLYLMRTKLYICRPGKTNFYEMKA